MAERGEKIVFCEPSCLSAVKEDAPSLLRGEAQKKARVSCAAHANCSTSSWPASIWRFKPVTGRILLHGHCHQKAMGLASRDSCAALPHSVGGRQWI